MQRTSTKKECLRKISTRNQKTHTRKLAGDDNRVCHWRNKQDKDKHERKKKGKVSFLVLALVLTSRTVTLDFSALVLVLKIFFHMCKPGFKQRQKLVFFKKT